MTACLRPPTPGKWLTGQALKAALWEFTKGRLDPSSPTWKQNQKPVGGGLESAEILLSYWMVEVGLEALSEEIYISFIFTRPDARGRGHGSRALDTVCKWADKERILLTLSPMPYGASPLSEKHTAAWYRRYGFEHTDLTTGMSRIPQGERS